MNKYVLDSFAILVFLQQEKGWERVRDLLKEAEEGTTKLYMSVINMAEVKYILARRGINNLQVIAAIEALPIDIVSADEYIDQVIELKASHAVSLADCFGAAIARNMDCPIVTADPEFIKLENILRVEWLR